MRGYLKAIGAAEPTADERPALVLPIDELRYRIFVHSPWQNAVSCKGRAWELNAQRLILRRNVATGSIRVYWSGIGKSGKSVPIVSRTAG